jgi:hypothetical protein
MVRTGNRKLRGGNRPRKPQIWLANQRTKGHRFALYCIWSWDHLSTERGWEPTVVLFVCWYKAHCIWTNMAWVCSDKRQMKRMLFCSIWKLISTCTDGIATAVPLCVDLDASAIWSQENGRLQDKWKTKRGGLPWCWGFEPGISCIYADESLKLGQVGAR